jgi:hypothetical protein
MPTTGVNDAIFQITDEDLGKLESAAPRITEVVSIAARDDLRVGVLLGDVEDILTRVRTREAPPNALELIEMPELTAEVKECVFR